MSNQSKQKQSDTRHNSADSVPTSNLICINEVAIRNTFCHMINIAGIIYYTCSLVIDLNVPVIKNTFKKRFERILCQENSAKIYSETNSKGGNAVFFRLCIGLMHITPPITGKGFDGSYHPKCAE